MDPTTVSTSYAELKKKYREFRVPTIRLLVEGTEIVESYGVAIVRLEVELTCRYPASGCSFDLVGEYIPRLNDFGKTKAVPLLELGAAVEVKLGYGAVESVFQGLITELDYHFEEDSAPYIHVECMDAKCLLMKTRRLEVEREQSLSSMVAAILSGQPVSRYLKGRKISPAGEAKPPVVRTTSDYDYLVQLARYTGSEFFILCGTAYFRPIPEGGAPVMKLLRGEALLSAKLALRGVELTKQIHIIGVDRTGAGAVKGTASSSGRFGNGATPARMLDGTELIHTDAGIGTASEAQERARVVMRELQSGFGRLECKCIGLPELFPGRMLRVEGMSKRMDGAYYIEQVRHTMDEDGFNTVVEAGMSSL